MMQKHIFRCLVKDFSFRRGGNARFFLLLNTVVLRTIDIEYINYVRTESSK